MNVVGVIIGILALIASVIATFIGGWIGGVIAIVLAAIAIALGFAAKKKSENGKGISAIVIGILSVVAAVSMIFATQNMMKTVKDNLLKETNKEGSKFATISKYAELADTNTGFVGFISSMLGKVTEEDKAAFEEESKNLANLLNESTENSGSTATAAPVVTEAPAENSDKND